MMWLNGLKVRGADTLNRAISKLFGHEADNKKQPPNLMGDMSHFTVHDLPPWAEY